MYSEQNLTRWLSAIASARSLWKSSTSNRKVPLRYGVIPTASSEVLIFSSCYGKAAPSPKGQLHPASLIFLLLKIGILWTGDVIALGLFLLDGLKALYVSLSNFCTL